MGCTFDCFTATWNSRSYLITLLIVAWVIPLIVILNSHLRIIMYLRTANIQSLLISNLPCRSRLHSNTVRHNEQGLDQEESSCGDNKCFPHVTQRVSPSSKSQLQFYIFKLKFNTLDYIQSDRYKFYIVYSFWWKKSSQKWSPRFYWYGLLRGHHMPQWACG